MQGTADDSSAEGTKHYDIFVITGSKRVGGEFEDPSRSVVGIGWSETGEMEGLGHLDWNIFYPLLSFFWKF